MTDTTSIKINEIRITVYAHRNAGVDVAGDVIVGGCIIRWTNDGQLWHGMVEYNETMG
jgi:hypothetical protein